MCNVKLSLFLIESESKLMGYGVSACATCDGFFFKEKSVIVIGGGDSAMEEALFLTKFAKKVYIIHRREIFRASQIMLNRAKANSKIEFILNTEIKKINNPDENKVTSAVLFNKKTSETTELNTGRGYSARAGSTGTAVLVIGGAAPNSTAKDEVEAWIGSAWTEVNDINTARIIRIGKLAIKSCLKIDCSSGLSPINATKSSTSG